MIFRAFNPEAFVNQHNQKVYLKTNKMVKADTAIINNNYGGYVCAAYKFDGKNNGNETGADVFVYVINQDSLQLVSDTILLLDIRLNRPWEQPIENYFQYIEPKKSLTGCMVSIPEKQIPAIKRYKFLYANVDLVTED